MIYLIFIIEFVLVPILFYLTNIMNKTNTSSIAFNIMPNASAISSFICFSSGSIYSVTSVFLLIFVTV